MKETKLTKLKNMCFNKRKRKTKRKKVGNQNAKKMHFFKMT